MRLGRTSNAIGSATDRRAIAHADNTADGDADNEIAIDRHALVCAFANANGGALTLAHSHTYPCSVAVAHECADRFTDKRACIRDSQRRRR